MRKALKYLLAIVGTTFLVIASGIVAFYFHVQQVTEDVDTICRIQQGTSVKAALKSARDLGFSENDKGALIAGIRVLGNSKDTPGMDLPWSDETIENIPEGVLLLGKVRIPPFGRSFCELSFQNGEVTASRRYGLD